MTTDVAVFQPRVVDGCRLPKRYRDALLPGRVIGDATGRARKLPRYFYEIDSWEQARALALVPHFVLWELMQTDVREAEALHVFPRYVPCAVTLLALALERFREEVGAKVFIAANGGYRSPLHGVNRHATTHSWGTAVNVYRIGDTRLDSEQAIGRYGAIVRVVLPGAWVRPFGHGLGCTDDHLHVDLGYVVAIPHDAPGDMYNPKIFADPL